VQGTETLGKVLSAHTKAPSAIGGSFDKDSRRTMKDAEIYTMGSNRANTIRNRYALAPRRQLLQCRTFGYGHPFGVLGHTQGREAGLDLREDIDMVLDPGMVISMAPMLTSGEGQPGVEGYREHDILVITGDGNEGITQYPYRPEYNIVG